MIIAPGVAKPPTQTPQSGGGISSYIEGIGNVRIPIVTSRWQMDALKDSIQSAKDLIARGNSKEYVQSIFNTEIIPTKFGLYDANANAKFSSDIPQKDVSTQIRDTALANLRNQQLRGLSSVVKKPTGLQLPTMKATLLK